MQVTTDYLIMWLPNPTTPVLCTYALQDYLVQWLYCYISSVSQQSEEAEFEPCLVIYVIT